MCVKLNEQNLHGDYGNLNCGHMNTKHFLQQRICLMIRCFEALKSVINLLYLTIRKRYCRPQNKNRATRGKHCFSYDPDKTTRTGSLYCFILVDTSVTLRKKKDTIAWRQEIHESLH
jgi:hypothetical protein